MRIVWRTDRLLTAVALFLPFTFVVAWWSYSWTRGADGKPGSGLIGFAAAGIFYLVACAAGAFEGGGIWFAVARPFLLTAASIVGMRIDPTLQEMAGFLYFILVGVAAALAAFSFVLEMAFRAPRLLARPSSDRVR
jgi:hypothetical protein